MLFELELAPPELEGLEELELDGLEELMPLLALEPPLALLGLLELELEPDAPLLK